MDFKIMLNWFYFLIPYFWIILLYPNIPREVFGLNKVVFIISCFILNLLIILFFSKDLRHMKQNIKQSFFYKLIFIVLIAISLLPFLMVFYTSDFYLKINLPIIISLICGIVFLAFSFKFPNIKHNRVVGIKTRWTLKSEKVWNKTHQVGAVTWIMAGALFIGNIFATSEFMYVLNILLGLGLVIAVPYLYSFIIWKKEEKTQ